MIKLLIKYKIIEIAIDNIFNTLTTNFTPAPVMNGIMEVTANGDNEWWLNHRLHRVNGPAIEGSDGYKAWYLYGVEYTKKDYWDQLK